MMKNMKFLALALSALCLPAFASAATLSRQLEIGMSGTDVSDLQTFLAQDNTIYPQGLVTGYFGPLTQSAVSNFQARNGISTVGRVGPITLVAINAQMSSGNKVGFDRTAPTIGGVSLNPNSSGATISWNTNEGSSAIVYYSAFPLVVTEGSSGKDVNISGSTMLVNTDMRATHFATLTGLKADTTYFYSLYVRDGSGNVSVTPSATFKTAN